jgi:hypothetical protein
MHWCITEICCGSTAQHAAQHSMHTSNQHLECGTKHTAHSTQHSTAQQKVFPCTLACLSGHASYSLIHTGSTTQPTDTPHLAVQVVGKTHMDELAYSLMGQNAHYGTPVNTAAPGRVPGGSSSGSAVSLAAATVAAAAAAAAAAVAAAAASVVAAIRLFCRPCRNPEARAVCIQDKKG